MEQAEAKLNAPTTNTPHFDDNLSEKDQIAKLKAQLRSLQRQLATQNDQLVVAPEASSTHAQNDQQTCHDSMIRKSERDLLMKSLLTETLNR